MKWSSRHWIQGCPAQEKDKRCCPPEKGVLGSEKPSCEGCWGILVMAGIWCLNPAVKSFLLNTFDSLVRKQPSRDCFVKRRECMMGSSATFFAVGTKRLACWCVGNNKQKGILIHECPVNRFSHCLTGVSKRESEIDVLSFPCRGCSTLGYLYPTFLPALLSLGIVYLSIDLDLAPRRSNELKESREDEAKMDVSS